MASTQAVPAPPAPVRPASTTGPHHRPAPPARGLYLLTIWLIEYDHEFQSGAATRLPVPVISTHAVLAITGLGLWGYYLFTDSTRLAWVAVAILAVVATLGLIMAARWVVVYRANRTPRAALAAVGAHSAPAGF